MPTNSILDMYTTIILEGHDDINVILIKSLLYLPDNTVKTFNNGLPKLLIQMNTKRIKCVSFTKNVLVFYQSLPVTVLKWHASDL